MGDEKIKYEQLPIPTYEEATAAESSSSLGPEHSNDDLERQGLLQHGESSNGGYHPPTVESARSSVDYLASSAPSSARQSVEDLRRELHQMDVDDSDSSLLSRPRLRHPFSKHFINPFSRLTKTLSSIQFNLPNFQFPRFWRYRISEDGFACMVFLRLLGIFVLVSLVYLVFVSDIFSVGSRFSVGQSYTVSSVENFVQGHINETNIANNLKKATQYTHIAGTEGSFVLAEWIQAEFAKAGLENIEMEEFQVYLNYPRQDGRRVAIIDPPDLAWEATIDEGQAYMDRQQTLVFHGHSKSGNVTGPLVYANYGSPEDFKTLSDNGISVDGAIVLVRYYGTQGDRALKVKAAELAGAAGCIIYSDPAQDGFLQGPSYPEGRYMPSDGVQRGAVSLMSWVVGDVLSPGFASTPNEKKRLAPEESPGLVQIPSIPLAWRDAQRLLQVLRGHGSKVPADWVGGVPDVSEWWTGDLSSPTINLMNIQDEVERQPIYNVLGRITGIEQPEKKIVVGNHRDSWCFGGVDPGSGTATFLEVVRVFGELKSVGWRPLRTIEFASWDGEEYNLIGSTEHVENEMDKLRKDGVAYINVDVGVSGNSFEAAGSPLFRRLLHSALGRVGDESANKTLKEIWDQDGKRLEGLGAGSDYVAFQDMAGTSSLDFTFGGAPFPYHSCYENYDWMAKFGDPDFRYHRMLGELWGLILYELADSPILPFDLEAYAAEFSGYVDNLLAYAQSKGVPLASTTQQPPEQRQRSAVVSLEPLYDAAEVFKNSVAVFQSWEQTWYTAVYSAGGFESNMMGVRRTDHNNRLAMFETHLLDLSQDGGVPNRTQFKHVLFAPQTWSGYDEAFFPSIRDAIDNGDWEATQTWVNRVAEIVTRASLHLNDQ